ncbi:hypothetical protein [Haloglomus halophilum]|uniref:hypothetical protein n=1 Tax=Haloglomus halophilum TaxID=2962672 RepID=UPI0020C958D9|nr:hypothetical protein [Haloglomus halophilum]
MPLPSGADYDIALPGWARLLAVLAGGVAVSGMADFALTQAGYPNLATFVWASGYAGTIIVVWVVWGQHLELVGDTGVGHEADSEENPPDDGDRSDPY